MQVGLTPRFILPGWQDSGPTHWQSLWEAQGLGTRVAQDDWLWPRRGDWMARLDEVILQQVTPAAPAILIAHSLGCHLVAAWAAHSAHTARVRGALLVAPPDTEREDIPPQLHGWRPIVRHRLPFRSIAVLSTNDPYGSLSRCSALVDAWGSVQVIAGALGHLNGESGLEDWPQGQAWLAALEAPMSSDTLRTG